MRRLTLYVWILPLLLAGCSPAAASDPAGESETLQFIAMDTSMGITAYGENAAAALRACQETVQDLEGRLSRTIESSDVSRLNAAGGEAVAVGEDLRTLLEISEGYRAATGGAFNIAMAPIVSAWGFTTDAFQVPGEEELHRLLALAKDFSLQETPGTVSIGPGQSVDLGAIAKGYAADRLAEVLREYAIPRGLARLGGSVLAYGGRPDGTPWRVGIQDPAKPGDPNAFAGVLNLTDALAVTSGGYQRYFEEDGKRYHHIMDPSTGYPADSGLASVTVVADCGGPDELPGAMCDAFSTALFVMGEEKALNFWRGWSGTSFELALVTEDGRVVVTKGLADRFTPGEESGYAYETVS